MELLIRIWAVSSSLPSLTKKILLIPAWESSSIKRGRVDAPLKTGITIKVLELGMYNSVKSTDCIVSLSRVFLYGIRQRVCEFTCGLTNHCLCVRKRLLPLRSQSFIKSGEGSSITSKCSPFNSR